MNEKQNPSPDDLESSTGDSAREESKTPVSYYYDDATGYEIYQDEDDIEALEQVDNTNCD